ncbi:unnamed protein product [Rotaria sp. Silwood2]|nr:unnamed protein product [Rotaria sp. Silwood2]
MSLTTSQQQKMNSFKLYMELVKLLEINQNGRLILPFARRLILIDRPIKKTSGNKHYDTCMLCQRQPYEPTPSTTQSSLSSYVENGSEQNTTFGTMSLPPSPFVCDPYESYDWEC